jgi:hypothetical protein
MRSAMTAGTSSQFQGQYTRHAAVEIAFVAQHMSRFEYMTVPQTLSIPSSPFVAFAYESKHFEPIIAALNSFVSCMLSQ